MVYQRRYFPALTITTISYAEKSVTAEKLADGAVIHPKVAPDAIDSERVIDGSLKSVDIKDGEIKTPDLADGAVTTPKIASAAVTPEKLSVSVLTRPVTPGVTSAEIGALAVTAAKIAALAVETTKIVNGAVTADKIGGEAVETTKIKDANVTLDKMAPDSIDNTVIKANTIRGTEIATGAVGVTELGTDSVQTVKIKDLHVTEPKLNLNSVSARTIIYDAVTEEKLHAAAFARRHKNSYLSRVIDHGEEFGGVAISDKWAKVLSVGGSVTMDNDKGLSIKSGTGAGWPSRIDFGGNMIGKPGTILPIMDIWITERNFNHHFTNVLGLWKDDDNYITFYADAPGAGAVNWFANCKVGGAATPVDTGVEVSTGIQLLSIEVVDATHVFFYINGVEVAEINTNIPAAVDVEPYLSLESRAPATDKTMLIKYVSLLLARPDYP